MFTTIADETGIGDPTRGESMETVGFHLVGLPDIVIEGGKLTNPRIYTNGDQFEIAGFTDSIATRMTENGSVETIARDKYSLFGDERYEDDSYKFNSFGVIRIKSVPL